MASRGGSLLPVILEGTIRCDYRRGARPAIRIAMAVAGWTVVHARKAVEELVRNQD